MKCDVIISKWVRISGSVGQQTKYFVSVWKYFIKWVWNFTKIEYRNNRIFISTPTSVWNGTIGLTMIFFSWYSHDGYSNWPNLTYLPIQKNSAERISSQFKISYLILNSNTCPALISGKGQSYLRPFACQFGSCFKVKILHLSLDHFRSSLSHLYYTLIEINLRFSSCLFL